MKKISRWASKNKISARVLIVLIHLILFYLGIKAGLIFWKLDIYISGWVLFTAILVYVSAFFLYPAKEDIRRSKNKKKAYRIQKTNDFLLGLSAFFMICFLSNHYFANRNSEISFLITPAFASTGKKPDANGILTSLSYKSKNDLSHQEKRILKKEFLKQCIRYVKAGSTGDSRVAAEAFEVMATIVAALGVLYLLAGLACSLSCSGSEGLAVLVTILGISGVVFGSVALMQTIFKTKKKNPS